MKKFVLFLTFIFSNFYFLYAQPVIEWQRSLGGSGEDNAYSIQQTSDGGYIVAGLSSSKDGDVTGNHDSSDYWIVKLDSSGIIQWQKSFGGNNFDIAYSIEQTTDGGYIVAGNSYSIDGDVTGNHGFGVDDYWIVKLDGVGNLKWQKSLGGSYRDETYSIQQTNDEGYIVAGGSASNDGDVTGNHGDGDYWIVKLDSLGSIIWQKSLGGTSLDFATSIQLTSDSGYIVAGYSFSHDNDLTINHGDKDYWIVKLDNVGAIEWQKSLGGTNEDFPRSIQQASDGGYIVAGNSHSDDYDVNGNHGINDYWIVKLNSIGELQWQKCLGGTGNDEASSIQQTNDSGFIIIGLSSSNDGDVTGNHNQGYYDYWIVKIDSTSAIQWQLALGGEHSDFGTTIKQTTDGGYIVAGFSDSNNGDVSGNHGESDYWVVKLSSFTVNVKEIPNSILDFQISPNPFSSKTIISLNNSFSDKINIVILDIEGRVIKNLVTKNLSGGTNELVWDATNNAGSKVGQGVYFIAIVSDNICTTKKAVVF